MTMAFWNNEIIGKIRRGYYSAVYFNRTKEILLREKNYKIVTMQIFQKHEGSVLCGIREVRELLKEATGYYEHEDWKDMSNTLTVESLSDGDKLISRETVMHLIGPYAYIAHLESLYLGILARRTLIATNTRKVVAAAGNKSVMFFADRFDDFLNQKGDGYAAKIGGANAVCTEAMSEGFGQEPVGTIPHALIAISNGNTLEAAKIFAKYFPNVKLIVLVDFDNDCVKMALLVARELGKKLWGVRIDTGENLIDCSLIVKNLNLKTPHFAKASRGEQIQAWSILKDTLAPQAAGIVHTDMERGFIAAEVCHYNELISSGSWPMAKDKGKIRTEGKTYIVQDGDVVLFRFNV